LGQTTIFASIPGPRTHELPSGSIHRLGTDETASPGLH
jgi:hypothetical protein